MLISRRPGIPDRQVVDSQVPLGLNDSSGTVAAEGMPIAFDGDI